MQGKCPSRYTSPRSLYLSLFLPQPPQERASGLLAWYDPLTGSLGSYVGFECWSGQAVMPQGPGRPGNWSVRQTEAKPSLLDITQGCSPTIPLISKDTDWCQGARGCQARAKGGQGRNVMVCDTEFSHFRTQVRGQRDKRKPCSSEGLSVVGTPLLTAP